MTTTPPPRKARQSRSGVALLIVLGCLIFLSVLVLAFLRSARTDAQASKTYSDSNAVRQLADVSVNLVMSQIRKATTEAGTAWASQPGMIRTFDTSGSLAHAYKLYSSDSMMATAVDPASEVGALAAWSSSPAVFTDLNQPALDVADSGKKLFPIIGPPVDLVDAKAKEEIGFSIDPDAPGVDLTYHPLPMPARWLYVLEDGTIVPAGGSGGKASVPGANEGNKKIVGRIAFWTDDETSKININTAGGSAAPGEDQSKPDKVADATFWSTPFFSAPQEYKLATNQPASGEFQRYPGHPATVALNYVLQKLGWAGLPPDKFYEAVDGNGVIKVNGHGITPRYAFGGSEGGKLTMLQVGESKNTSDSGVPKLPLVAGARLYASTSEMLFDPTRTASLLNDKTSDKTQEKMQSARFFLTAHSRAPELNLFGQPRISMWPVWDLSDGRKPPGNKVPQRTAIDELLAFCATIGTPGVADSFPYYFTRVNPASSTTDVDLKRNKPLLKYLDSLTSSDIPGFGGNFKAKYGERGKRQILTEIFDYIRTINLADTNVEPKSQYALNWAPYTAVGNPNPYGPFYSWPSLGRFQVAPSVKADWDTQGIAAYPRLTEFAIQFVAMGHGPMGATPAIPLAPPYKDGGVASALIADKTQFKKITAPPNSPTLNCWEPLPNLVAVQAFILLQFTNPSKMLESAAAVGGSSAGQNNAGGAMNPFCWVSISGLDSFKLAGKPLLFPKDQKDQKMIIGSDQTGGPPYGVSAGNIPFTSMMSSSGWTRGLKGYLSGSAATAADRYNPFFSKIITVPVSIPIADPNKPASNKNTMPFEGGTITVTLYDAANFVSAPGAVVQTYTIEIPSGSFPVPQVTYKSVPSGTVTGKNNQLYETPPVALPSNTQPSRWGPFVGLEHTSLATNPVLVPGVANRRYYDRWDYRTGGQGGVRPQFDPGFAPIGEGDVVQSMILKKEWSDSRVLAVNEVKLAFKTHPQWGPNNRFAHNLTFMEGFPFNQQTFGTTGNNRPATGSMGVLAPGIPLTAYNGNGYRTYSPSTPSLLDAGAKHDNGDPSWDWDNGLSWMSDGPWVNKADEGVGYPPKESQGIRAENPPYYARYGLSTNSVGAAFFSPNRQVPSAGMLGSLPTGVDPAGTAPKSWQTLLFRPGPGNHPGEASPPDHLMLDLFWMPVAEPYAISEQFSTAGKINLNYQIMPFTYIERSTALRAAILPEKIAKVGGNKASTYKYNANLVNSVGMQDDTRFPLDLDETLQQFQDKFASGEIFHSASQICEMYLVPAGAGGLSGFKSQWYQSGVGGPFALVGDNVRERPYANILGKVTTKSNTYQVHYRVQSLQKASKGSATQWTEWDEDKDVVTGERRGSVIVERYLDLAALLDPDSPSGPYKDPAEDPLVTNSLEGSYRFRVVNSTYFHP